MRTNIFARIFYVSVSRLVFLATLLFLNAHSALAGQVGAQFREAIDPNATRNIFRPLRVLLTIMTGDIARIVVFLGLIFFTVMWLFSRQTEYGKQIFKILVFITVVFGLQWLWTLFEPPQGMLLP